MRYLLLLYFIAVTHLCFGQTFKVGVFTTFARDISKYASFEDNSVNSGENFVHRYKLGVRASYSPWYKLSIEPGIAISSQEYSDDVIVEKKRVKSRVRFDLGNNNFLALRSHKTKMISPSIGLLFKTNRHKGCVTFITLNFSRNYTIGEKEDFVSYTKNESLVINNDNYSSNESQLQHQGTEIDFSFGAYWYVGNFDGEIRLEPKFNLYRKRENNNINTVPELNLYNSDNRGYANLGFEISVNKNLRRRRDKGHNHNEHW